MKFKQNDLFGSSDNSFKKVRLNELIPHPKNTTLHPEVEDEKEIERIKQSILEQGLINPICCKEENGRYVILSGHLRHKALTCLVNEGYEHYHEIQVKIVSFDTEEDELEYLLDANALTRRTTDYTKMMHIATYSQIYDEKKKNSELNIGDSEQAYISQKMGISKRQVCKFLFIRNNLEEKVINEIISGNEMSLNKLYQRMKELEIQEMGLDEKDIKKSLISDINFTDENISFSVKTEKTLQKVSKDLERLNKSVLSLLQCKD